MGITAESGPLLVWGQLVGNSTTGLTGTIPPTDYNDQRAPSLFDLGQGMLDPRAAYNYEPGSAVTAKTFGFYDGRGTVDFVPTTLSASALVANSVVSTGVTTYTITASSSLGTYSTTIIAPETGKATGTLLAIDSTAAYLAFGVSGTFNMWNPGAGTGRCISITTSSSGDGGTYSISGRDMYGYKMTETIALSQGTSNSSGISVTGQKAFKYISSITNTTTPTSTGISIGLSDRYGMPFAVPYSGNNIDLRILPTVYASSLGSVTTSSANFILASTAATATSTTADVRGVWVSTTASNGTLRLQIRVTPSASAVAAITSTNVAPLFGVAQYSA